MDLDLPQGSLLVADKAYTDYDHQDTVEDVGLASKGPGKKNSKRPMAAWEEFLSKPR
jgi:hypothetical protein